jgi:hypothetical protein
MICRPREYESYRKVSPSIRAAGPDIGIEIGRGPAPVGIEESIAAIVRHRTGVICIVPGERSPDERRDIRVHPVSLRSRGLLLCLPQSWNLAHVHLSLSMPGIGSCLQAKPDGRSVADQLADPGCTIGADGLLLFKDFVKVLPGNSEQPGDLKPSACLAKAGCHREPLRGEKGNDQGYAWLWSRP